MEAIGLEIPAIAAGDDVQRSWCNCFEQINSLSEFKEIGCGFLHHAPAKLYLKRYPNAATLLHNGINFESD